MKVTPIILLSQREGAFEHPVTFPYVQMWDQGWYPRVWCIEEHRSIQEGLQAYLNCRTKLFSFLIGVQRRDLRLQRKCVACRKIMRATTIVAGVAPRILIIRLGPPHPPKGSFIPPSKRPQCEDFDRTVTFCESTYHLRYVIYLDGDHYRQLRCEDDGPLMKRQVVSRAEVLFYTKSSF